MNKCINNCGECPFFEWYLDEYEPLVKSKVGKGRCRKFDNEIWETKSPCYFAEESHILELEQLAFG